MRRMEIDQDYKFAVIAESKDYDKELYLHNLTFAQLMDDIVVPYESGKPFFIDGVPVDNKKNLKKIKIIRQDESFEESFNHLHHFLRAGSGSKKRVSAEDYPVRLQALFREAGDDVTSQIIKAYNLKIGPSIKDYLPKREELIRGAFQIFIEAMKLFAKGT